MYQNKTELVGKKLPVRFPHKKIDELAKKNNLSINNKITKTLISQIIATSKHRVPYGQGNAFISLLLKIEDEFLI